MASTFVPARRALHQPAVAVFPARPCSRRNLKVIARAEGSFQPDLWEQVGFAVGTVALTLSVFVAVSYLELQKKIAEQTDAGEDVYQLKVEERRKNNASREYNGADEGDSGAPKKEKKKGKGKRLPHQNFTAPGFRISSQKPTNTKG